MMKHLDKKTANHLMNYYHEHLINSINLIIGIDIIISSDEFTKTEKIKSVSEKLNSYRKENKGIIDF